MQTISDITPYGLEIDDEWVDLRVIVKELWDEPPHPKMKQFGILTDGTQTLPFVNWAASDQPELELGTTYELHDAYRDLYDGDQRVVLRSDTVVDRIDDPSNTETVLGWASTRDDFRDYADTLFVTPVIENVFDDMSRFISIRGDRHRDTRHYDYHAPHATWADIDHHVRVTPDGLDIHFGFEVDPDAYHTQFPDGYGSATKRRNIERKMRDNINAFITDNRATDGLDITVDGEVDCCLIHQCGDCGANLYGSGDTLFCNADDCDAGQDAPVVSATIPRRITVDGIIGGPIESMADLEAALDEVGGTLKYSSREAMGVIAEAVEADPSVADTGGEATLRFHQSDHYGIPQECYTDVTVEFRDAVNVSAVEAVCDRYAAVGLGTQAVTYDTRRDGGDPYAISTQDDTTLKVTSRTVVTEYSSYTSLDSVIEENADHQPDAFAVLVDDHRRHIAPLLDDRFDLRHI